MVFILLLTALLLLVNREDKHEGRQRLRKDAAPFAIEVADDAQLNSPAHAHAVGATVTTLTTAVILEDETEPGESIAETAEETAIRADDVANDEELDLPLRERLRLKSIEAKEFVRQMLEELVEPIPNPLYHHYQETANDEDEVGNQGLSCDQEDAFSGIPIDGVSGSGWVPPDGHSKKKLKKWEDAYAKAMQNIKEGGGGEKLQSIAKDEVQHLRKLRHQLFCGD